MKTIHVLIAATAFAVAPLAAHAQSAPTTTTATDATGTPEPSDATTQSADATGTGSDVGSTGTGTGTLTNDIGSTGTGTGTNDVGSTGTGTGTIQATATSYEPAVSLSASVGTLRTPGSLKVTVTLAADASLDPPQGRDISVPLASSSTSCMVPAAVTVAWTSAAGGSASVDVACKKAGTQTVTISSGASSTSFTTK